MKILKLHDLPRYITIIGNVADSKLTVADYEELKSGATVDVDDDTAKYLSNFGFCLITEEGE
jgi:hypothetical protein